MCTLTTGATAVGVAAAAWAAPGAQALDARSMGVEVQSLRAQAEIATQQYDAATQDLARLQQRIDAIQAQTSLLQQQVDSVSGSLGRLAAAQYRGSGVDPTLQLMLAQQPDQFLRRAAALDAVGRGEGVELRNVLAEQQQITQFRAQAATDLAEQAQAEQRAAAARGRILAEYQRAQMLLAQLTTAQQAALDGSGVTPEQIAALPQAQGRVASAIDFAESKLGLWYQWGGTGDPSYDCSGLVQAAWASAGVSLPRVTWDQLTTGQPVPAQLGDLRPGDLIFYLDGAHVAMYVGSGLVVHAPTTGQRIQYGRWDMMPITAVRRVLPG
ncbi:MAG TPA: NlpC/P60 family protein [Actinospica sp.]|nr:NlpC/P60 family protein [Actinospica sp.]